LYELVCERVPQAQEEIITIELPIEVEGGQFQPGEHILEERECEAALKQEGVDQTVFVPEEQHVDAVADDAHEVLELLATHYEANFVRDLKPPAMDLLVVRSVLVFHSSTSELLKMQEKRRPGNNLIVVALIFRKLADVLSDCDSDRQFFVQQTLEYLHLHPFTQVISSIASVLRVLKVVGVDGRRYIVLLSGARPLHCDPVFILYT